MLWGGISTLQAELLCAAGILLKKPEQSLGSAGHHCSHCSKNPSLSSRLHPWSRSREQRWPQSRAAGMGQDRTGRANAQDGSTSPCTEPSPEFLLLGLTSQCLQASLSHRPHCSSFHAINQRALQKPFRRLSCVPLRSPHPQPPAQTQQLPGDALRSHKHSLKGDFQIPSMQELFQF